MAEQWLCGRDKVHMDLAGVCVLLELPGVSARDRRCFKDVPGHTVTDNIAAANAATSSVKNIAFVDPICEDVVTWLRFMKTPWPLMMQRTVTSVSQLGPKPRYRRAFLPQES